MDCVTVDYNDIILLTYADIIIILLNSFFTCFSTLIWRKLYLLKPLEAKFSRSNPDKADSCKVMINKMNCIKTLYVRIF